MKKNRSLSAKSLTSVPILLSFTLSLTSAVYAQKVSLEISKPAKEACIKVAKEKGYDKINIVSVEPKGTDGANVVLNLTKDGHTDKLTCGWSKKAGAAFGEDKAATPAPVATPVATPAVVTTPQAAPTPAPEHHGFPWWLLAIPILGALAYFFLRKKEPEIVQATPRATGYDTVEQYEGIIENNGNAVDVYSQPNSSSLVTGSLNDGQRVTLSGTQDNNWSQLSDGGWIPTRFIRKQTR